MQQPAMRRLSRIGSLKLTAVGLALLIAGVLTAHLTESDVVWWLVIPLAILAVNLAAAVVVDPRLNRRPGLLLFHLALLAVIAIATYDRLVGFHGRIELVQGQAFDADTVTVRRAGPLHDSASLNAVQFVQGQIRIDYAADIIRQKTVSLIREDDTAEPKRIGDNLAYAATGYTFHTTSNKGFAAIVTWESDAGIAKTGAVHFPSYPLNEWRQKTDWRPPGGALLELTLTGLEPLDDTMAFSLDVRAAQKLGLGLSGRTLRPGEEARLAGGRLRLETVTLWLGYEIRSEPPTQWMLLAAAMGICGIGWHFLGAPGGRRTAPDRRVAAENPVSGVQHG